MKHGKIEVILGDILSVDNANGRVGIGVTPTSGKLTIKQTTAENAVEIDNDSTQHGLYIHQDGVLATNNHALYIYSNAAQVNGRLVKIHQDNASSTMAVLTIENDGSGVGIELNQNGNGNYTFLCRNYGTGTNLYILQMGNLASAQYALFIDNNGTPVDGAGRAIRIDGCNVTSTKNPETDSEYGWIGVNVEGVQYAVPYYTLS